MIRANLVAALLAAAACGGPGAPTTTPAVAHGGGAAAGGDAATLWAAVMQPGAVFSFHDYIDGGPLEVDEATVVEATVSEVRDVDGGRAAILT